MLTALEHMSKYKKVGQASISICSRQRRVRRSFYLGCVDVLLKDACLYLLLQVIQHLRNNNKAVPPAYLKDVMLARAVFRHQTVYCPAKGETVHLTVLPPGGLGFLGEDADLSFLGAKLPKHIARGIAEGTLTDPPNSFGLKYI